jgi:hypothetical protein
MASTSQVTRLMDVPNKESPDCLVRKSSIANGSGRYILFFNI